MPVIKRAGHDRDRTISIKPNGALFGGHRRGGFDIAGDTKPAQLAGALARTLTLLEAFDIGARERVLEQAGKIAAVIRHA